MDRDLPIDARETDVGRPEPKDDRPSHGANHPDRGMQKSSPERAGREVLLSGPDRQTLAEIGRFRTVASKDLARTRHNGDTVQMQQDIRNLASRGLIQTRTVWLARRSDRLDVVALTRRGKQFLEHCGEQGTFYAGFVKPAELAHDAAIYRIYQAEAAKIAKQGGQIRCITLDYELKRDVYSPLAKEKPASSEYKKRQAEIAAQHHLKVVRGHIQLPDLRIEYRRSDGDIEVSDFELATAHYRPAQLAAKAQAGFHFYANTADRARLASVFDDHHITSEILWL